MTHASHANPPPKDSGSPAMGFLHSIQRSPRAGSSMNGAGVASDSGKLWPHFGQTTGCWGDCSLRLSLVVVIAESFRDQSPRGVPVTTGRQDILPWRV